MATGKIIARGNAKGNVFDPFHKAGIISRLKSKRRNKTEFMTTDELQSTKKKRTLREYGGITLRGIAMGAADIVPGVSGGTMALILGIYEELIESIRAVGQPELWRAIIKFRVKDVFKIVNWEFLLAVATGILIAILTLSQGLEYVLKTYPVYIWSFFFGLVLASVYTVSKQVKHWAVTLGVAVGAGAIGAYILVGAVPAQTPTTWWFYMLSGALAICAMILPGISGAFILVLLGKYLDVLTAVNNRDFVTIGFVGIGAVIGLVTFAQLLGWLFKKYHDMTLAVLIGLMLGSLRKLWPWKKDMEWLLDEFGEKIIRHGEVVVSVQKNILPPHETTGDWIEIGLAFSLAIIGFVAILVLNRVATTSE